LGVQPAVEAFFVVRAAELENVSEIQIKK